MCTITASQKSTPATIQMSAITPKALKQFQALSKADQLRVAEKVCEPIMSSRCRPVKNLAKFGVAHFDASETLRVSHLRHKGQEVIVHCGVHPEFDHFAEFYQGEDLSNLIPIKNSIITEIHAKRNLASTAPKAKEPVNVIATTAAVQTESELIAQAISLIADKAMESKQKMMTQDINAAEDLVREVDGKLTLQLDLLTGQLEGAKDDFRKQLASLHEKTLAADKVLQAHRQTLEKELETCRSYARNQRDEVLQTTEEANRKLELEMTARQRELTEASGVFEAHVVGLEARLARMDSVFCTSQASIESLRQLVGQLADTVTKIANEPKPSPLGQKVAAFFATLRGWFSRRQVFGGV